MVAKTIFSDEHKAAISRARMGQTHSEETKEVIRQKLLASWKRKKEMKAKAETQGN